MTITITAFERSPDGGKGLARDTRVRWALEEVGQPYEVRLVSFRAMKEPAHLRFILSARFRPMRKAISPCSRQGRSCSISPSAMRACCRTMPMPGRARSPGCSPRSTRWSRRSSNSQPPSSWRATSPGPKSACLWSRIASATGCVQLSARLGDADWLDGAFSAGDLMMVSVLLRLRPSGILDEFPNLAAYVARGEARPAYQRAFAAQWAINAGNPQAGS